jgi:hypothetical protein
VARLFFNHRNFDFVNYSGLDFGEEDQCFVTEFNADQIKKLAATEF